MNIETIIILGICILMSSTLFIYLEILIGAKKIKNLKDIKPLEDNAVLPKVSIVFAALNEEQTIGPALQSLLEIDYDNLEIIAINDRSTDSTGEILEDLSRENTRLEVYHLQDCPHRWLGKNHALQYGAAKAQGEYILFTDADVHMEQNILRHVISYMEKQKLDFFTLLFEAKTRNLFLNVIMLEIFGFLGWRYKPWKAKDPKSNRYIGAGAFNLVKREVYRKNGGHTKISLSPIDDMMLGKLLKKNGAKQDCLFGQDFIHVEWYSNLKDMIKGLEKNSYALFNYNFLYFLITALLSICLGIIPFWLAIWTSGILRILGITMVVLRLMVFVVFLRRLAINPLYSLYGLLSNYLIVFILFRNVLLTLVKGGMQWRGTFYSLKELKAQKY